MAPDRVGTVPMPARMDGMASTDRQHLATVHPWRRQAVQEEAT